jgi:hypothetical protein
VHFADALAALHQRAGGLLPVGGIERRAPPELVRHVGHHLAGAAAIVTDEAQRLQIAYERVEHGVAAEDRCRAAPLAVIGEMHRLRQDDDRYIPIPVDQHFAEQLEMRPEIAEVSAAVERETALLARDQRVELSDRRLERDRRFPLALDAAEVVDAEAAENGISVVLEERVRAHMDQQVADVVMDRIVEIDDGPRGRHHLGDAPEAMLEPVHHHVMWTLHRIRNWVGHSRNFSISRQRILAGGFRHSRVRILI